MGCRILVGKLSINDIDEVACLYDSVSMMAFGPVFSGGKGQAERFLEYLTDKHGVLDARGVDLIDLMMYFAQFCKEYPEDEDPYEQGRALEDQQELPF